MGMRVSRVKLDGALEQPQRLGVVAAGAAMVMDLAGQHQFVGTLFSVGLWLTRSWMLASILPGRVETTADVTSS